MKNTLKKIGRITGGILLILLGIIGGFIPILQGWMFILAGLYLLKDDIPIVRKYYDQIVQWIEEKKQKQKDKKKAKDKIQEEPVVTRPDK
jgi:predicted tellurium resistance membrane protein TerC